jgi:hypothetical protein
MTTSSTIFDILAGAPGCNAFNTDFLMRTVTCLRPAGLRPAPFLAPPLRFGLPLILKVTLLCIYDSFSESLWFHVRRVPELTMICSVDQDCDRVFPRKIIADDLDVVPFVACGGCCLHTPTFA